VERDGEWHTLINVLLGNNTGHAFTIRHLPVATDFLLCFPGGSNGGAFGSGFEGANLPSPSMSVSRPYAFGVCVGEKSALVLEVHFSQVVSVEHGQFLFTIA
jgi:hypothetical protein